MSLSITDLNVWIGDAHILRGITLEVPDGQHVGIIGSSGSGKSMLSLAIMGLLPEGARVEGSIRWNGRELSWVPPSGSCARCAARRSP